jgi:hypothetical protein
MTPQFANGFIFASLLLREFNPYYVERALYIAENQVGGMFSPEFGRGGQAAIDYYFHHDTPDVQMAQQSGTLSQYFTRY